MESQHMNIPTSTSRKPLLPRRAGAAAAAGLALSLLMTTPVHAVRPGEFKLTGASLETGTDLVSLPSPGSDLVLARECAACDALELRIAPTTEFRINGKAVPYAEFRQAATGGPHSLYVYYRRADHTLLRLNLEIYD
jgi:hypothetical protein